MPWRQRVNQRIWPDAPWGHGSASDVCVYGFTAIHVLSWGLLAVL